MNKRDANDNSEYMQAMENAIVKKVNGKMWAQRVIANIAVSLFAVGLFGFCDVASDLNPILRAAIACIPPVVFAILAVWRVKSGWPDEFMRGSLGAHWFWTTVTAICIVDMILELNWQSNGVLLIILLTLPSLWVTNSTIAFFAWPIFVVHWMLMLSGGPDMKVCPNVVAGLGASFLLLIGLLPAYLKLKVVPAWLRMRRNPMFVHEEDTWLTLIGVVVFIYTLPLGFDHKALWTVVLVEATGVAICVFLKKIKRFFTWARTGCLSALIATIVVVFAILGARFVLHVFYAAHSLFLVTATASFICMGLISTGTSLFQVPFQPSRSLVWVAIAAQCFLILKALEKASLYASVLLGFLAIAFAALFTADIARRNKLGWTILGIMLVIWDTVAFVGGVKVGEVTRYLIIMIVAVLLFAVFWFMLRKRKLRAVSESDIQPRALDSGPTTATADKPPRSRWKIYPKRR